MLQGDSLTVLKTLPGESVHCVVTSPPYWGLRDYGVAGQLGVEPTPEQYVAKMVEVFREVRRVLRGDGTCWVNIGDCYCAQPAGNFESTGGSHWANGGGCQYHQNKPKMSYCGLKPKDLVGMPWRLAFALQADGWVLRQEIIWSKPNAMPESCTDRCTKSHEQIFLFCKATWSGPPNRRFKNISNQDARWLALFLDTEGNICAKRAKASSGTDHFGLQICFANTSQVLVARAHSIIGAGTVLERAGKNSPMFYYQLSNIQASDLLYELYPHLIIKQRQAALGIYLQSLIAESEGERRTKEGRKRGRLRDDDYTEELVKIWATMKSLNHFGNPDLSWVPIPKYGRWAGCASYFYDAEAVKERASTDPHNSGYVDGAEYAVGPMNRKGHSQREDPERIWAQDGTRNRRSVWTIPSQPYPESHFATFPENLVKPCILAGTSAKGACPKCLAPWQRVVEKSGGTTGKSWHDHKNDLGQGQRSDAPSLAKADYGNGAYQVKTLGWQPTCRCGDMVNDGEMVGKSSFKPIPCTVLDPFAGSGTTLQVALELGRSAIGIELNPIYVELARTRCAVTPSLQLA